MTGRDDCRRVGRATGFGRARVALLSALFVALLVSSAAAHRGPPFPVLVDHRLKNLPYRLSVWTDPDIGDARFFMILEPVDDDRRHEPVPQVAFWVEPVSGRLARTGYAAQRQELRGQIQFAAQPHFDQRDLWRVGIELTDSARQTDTVTLEIESTPPGLGAWDLVLYSFPFLMFGALWARAILARRASCAHARQTTPRSASA